MNALNKYHSLILIFYLSLITLFAQNKPNVAGVPTYSITASGRVFSDPPFKSCHAATLVETGKDTLLYAWFAGDHEGAKNASIWARYRYLGKNPGWSELILLATGQDATGNPQPCWNPVLFKTRDGVIWLDYKVGPNPRQWWAERKISTDNGVTWSQPKKLAAPFLGPIKNKPLQLNDGAILYPSSTESMDEKTWKVHLEISDAAGANWQYIPIACDSFGVIQPAILRYGPDSLQMLCRSRQNTIVQTWSFDNGRSWSSLSALNIPNPNAGIDAVTLHDGWQLLVYNPMLAGADWWVGRSKLKVAVSKNGQVWQDIATLEDHANGEYSYPAVIQSSNRMIHIAYTENRKNIKFVDIGRE